MKPKHLYIMGGILVVLVLLSLVKPSGEDGGSITEQAQWTALMPADLTLDSVAAIELVGGKEKPVRVERAAGKGWIVSSAWQAPGNEKKITEFLEALKGMQGDLVSENEKLFNDYKVDDKNGIVVRLFKAGGEAPAFEVIVGKQRGYDESLVRLKGGDKVYAVAKNLRSLFGMYSVDTKPNHRSWLKKEVVKLEKEKIRKVELSYPDHSLTFENKEIKEKDKPATRKWALVSGGPGGEFKEDEWGRLLDGLSSMEIDDVMDPARKKEVGLDKPSYQLMVSMEDGKKVELAAVRNSKDSKAYLFLKDAPERLYSMHTWGFDRVFKHGKDLFDLKAPAIEKDKVVAMSLKRGKEALSLSRKDKDSDWVLQAPKTKFGVSQSVVKDLVSELADWKPQDYTDARGKVALGLTVPRCEIEVVLSGGTKKTLVLGGGHPGFDMSYVAEKGQNKALVMESADVEKAFPAVDKILDLSRKLVDWKAEDVASVSFQSAEGKRVLKRTGKDAWQMMIDEKTSRSADADKALGQIEKILGLTASGLLPGDQVKSALAEAGQDTVTLVSTKDETVTLRLGAVLKDNRAAGVSTEPLPLLLSKSDAEVLLPSVEDLLPDASAVKTEKKGKPVTVKKTIKNPFE